MKFTNTHGENLNLPICPKCNDTKYIKEVRVIPLKATFVGAYECTKCEIEWERNKPYYPTIN